MDAGTAVGRVDGVDAGPGRVVTPGASMAVRATTVAVPRAAAPSGAVLSGAADRCSGTPVAGGTGAPATGAATALPVGVRVPTSPTRTGAASAT